MWSSACCICLSYLSWLQTILLCHPGLITASSPSATPGGRYPPWKLICQECPSHLLSTESLLPKMKGTGCMVFCGMGTCDWDRRTRSCQVRVLHGQNISAHPFSLSPASTFQTEKLRLLKILKPQGLCGACRHESLLSPFL